MTYLDNLQKILEETKTRSNKHIHDSDFKHQYDSEFKHQHDIDFNH